MWGLQKVVTVYWGDYCTILFGMDTVLSNKTYGNPSQTDNTLYHNKKSLAIPKKKRPVIVSALLFWYNIFIKE